MNIELAKVLLPYQRRWIADTADVKIAEKARRIGFTWAEALALVLDAAPARDDGGLNGWYVGYNKEMAREFIDDCAYWIRQLTGAAADPADCLVRDEERDIQAYEIRLASGNKITALSSTPRNLRGKEGVAVLDEAAWHRDLASLLKAALAFLTWGGKVRILSTHNGAASPFNQIVIETRAGARKGYSLHRVTFREAIAEGLYHKICEARRRNWTAQAQAAWIAEMYEYYGDDAAEELDCIPNPIAGAFMGAALIDARMRDGLSVIRLALDDEFLQKSGADRRRIAAEFCERELTPALARLDGASSTALGEDFARDGDLSVIFAAQRGKDRIARCALAVEMRNVPYQQQDDIFTFLAGAVPRFAGAAMDARGSGRFLAEAAAGRFGAKIHALTMTREWYADAMPAMKAEFEDGTIEIPRDRDILADLRSLQLIDGIAKPPEKRALSMADRGKRHGDAAIALALALFALKQKTVSYDGFVSVPRGREAAPAAAPGAMAMQPPQDESDAGRGRRAQMERCF